jgi:hypothetical protein
MIVALAKDGNDGIWPCVARECGFRVNRYADEQCPNRPFGWANQFTPWGLAYNGGEVEFPATGAKFWVLSDPALDHYIGATPFPAGVGDLPLAAYFVGSRMKSFWDTCPTYRGFKKYGGGGIAGGCEKWDASIAASTYFFAAIMAVDSSASPEMASHLAIFTGDGPPPADWRRLFNQRRFTAREIWTESSGGGVYGQYVIRGGPPRIDVICGPVAKLRNSGPSSFFIAAIEIGGQFYGSSFGNRRKFPALVSEIERNPMIFGCKKQLPNWEWAMNGVGTPPPEAAALRDKIAQIGAAKPAFQSKFLAMDLGSDFGRLRYYLQSVRVMQRLREKGLDLAYRDPSPSATAFARFMVAKYKREFGEDVFDRADDLAAARACRQPRPLGILWA